MVDAQRFGMDPVSIARLRAALDAGASSSDTYEGLWPEHVSIVNAFLLVSSQWRVGAVGSGMMSPAGGFSASQLVFIGLDYSAVRVALEAEGIAITRDLWRGLRIMEFAAIAALNENGT